MRKLIERTQEVFIQCDNPQCNYSIPFHPDLEKYTVLFVDEPCPKCGENLLTKEDYLQHKRLLKIVDWLNKWFSWITIFQSKKDLKNEQTISVHVHNGIKIENITPKNDN